MLSWLLKKLTSKEIKGKNIRKIEEETGVSVEIDDDGILTLGSTEEDSLAAAKEMVMLIIDPPEVEVDTDYDGEVVSVATYGAFINILPGRDGLLHISKFHSEKRVKNPENVLNIGDKIKVHVDSIENGKVSLSLLEDLDIPEESIDTGGGNRGNRDSRPRRNDRSGRGNSGRGNSGRGNSDRGNRSSRQSDDSSKRKRVSFEDEFEKGI